jgi:hypothetical protein
MADDAATRDVRFGHDLTLVQDENGVDLTLLRANLALTVEQRLLALQDLNLFVSDVRLLPKAP